MNKLSKIFLLLGSATVIATFIIGYFAYQSSRETLVQNVYKNNLELSRLFRDYLSPQGIKPLEGQALSNLRNLWSKIELPYKGGYVCVVNSKGALTLHTAEPQLEGDRVSEKSMVRLKPNDPATLGELVHQKRDWVGPYISSAGQEQVTAFSYIPTLDSVVSVHVPLSEIEQQISETTVPWIVSFMIIGAILFPISLLILHKAYQKSQIELYATNKELNREIGERKSVENELNNLNNKLESRIKERTEELIEAKNAAEEANKMKSDFIGRMSHELRTPMNAILGFGQLLLLEKDKDYSGEHAKEILNAGHHLLSLINEVLDLSRIESGNYAIMFEDISLFEITSECVSMIAPLADQSHITVSNNIKSENDFILHVDQLRLKEVLVNLLSNAIKYNIEEGRVFITADQISDNKIRIYVKDTGPGISVDNQKLIFDAFNRLDAEYGTIEGTGIGLTISKQLMELMDGSIGLDSQLGEGSTFWIECQISQSVDLTTEISTSVPEKSSSDQKRTILYVEDNPANLRLVEQIIMREPDLELISSKNAEDGIKLARTVRPDLIIMDINLPGMDGYEALSMLRDIEETNAIPVIALSADANPRNIERGIMAGFRCYLAKPIQIKELLDAIRTVGGTELKN